MKKILCIVSLLPLLFWQCHKKAVPPATDSTMTTPPPPVTSAPPPPPPPPPASVDMTQPFVKFMRTACYGKCPVYEATIAHNGNVEYLGKNHVARIGKYQGRLTPREIETLRSMIKDMDFVKMSDTYPANGKFIPDLPFAVTAYMGLDGTSKTIRNNHDAPEKLQKLEKYIDAILETVKWSAVEEKK